MGGSRFLPQLFGISFSAPLLAIAHPRIIGFGFHDRFTQRAIGFALLGLGPGGVFPAVSRRLRAADPERLGAVAAVVGGVAGLALRGLASRAAAPGGAG
jgi:hypothetical protein